MTSRRREEIQRHLVMEIDQKEWEGWEKRGSEGESRQEQVRGHLRIKIIKTTQEK